MVGLFSIFVAGDLALLVVVMLGKEPAFRPADWVLTLSGLLPDDAAGSKNGTGPHLSSGPSTRILIHNCGGIASSAVLGEWPDQVVDLRQSPLDPANHPSWRTVATIAGGAFLSVGS